MAKKKLQSYSERAIEESDVESESTSHQIFLTYGIVIPSCGYDQRVKIGSEVLSSTEIRGRLDKLTKRTRRNYSVNFICPEECERQSNADKFDGLAVIGRGIGGMDIYASQGSQKLVSGEGLAKVVNEGPQIIEDLKTLGFRNITTKDLYLFADFYFD